VDYFVVAMALAWRLLHVVMVLVFLELVVVVDMHVVFNI
jgi:cytochrome c oxidase subunit IV